MHRSQEDVALSEAPTAALSKPASTELSARQAARATEDPEQTLPLSRTVSGGLMGNGGGQLASLHTDALTDVKFACCVRLRKAL